MRVPVIGLTASLIAAEAAMFRPPGRCGLRSLKTNRSLKGRFK